ncbi:NAD-dependent epimerase/dehydratase [Planoprotostelium fungivorum]|uniref:NAD-dependent epimerase/dehydratase n=1 Tax=Planoprotostelium fungivorum TaxID=1890364 RepID=A0A2P6NPJ6_9EUKA|nr:NAD-dependent epimerase/dehydratase [Planoprotostelium fungivorum]
MPLKVFVTGASGFIGTEVTKELISHGHTVVGLARSDASAEKLKNLGAQVVRGGLHDLDTLTSAARSSDAVIHLAFDHSFDRPDYNVAEVCAADIRALRALAEGIRGTKKPLVNTTGTLVAPEGQTLTETTPKQPGPARNQTEDFVQEAAREGLNSVLIRLAPSVHGEGDPNFLKTLVHNAKKEGRSIYVGDGSHRWPGVSKYDAAVLYRLAVEQQLPPGTVLHAIEEESIRLRDIAEVIGKKLKVPTQSITKEEALAKLGFVGWAISLDNPVTKEKTVELTGWKSASRHSVISRVDLQTSRQLTETDRENRSRSFTTNTRMWNMLPHLLFALFISTASASSIFYDAPPTIESGIADREAFLISQWKAQLSDLQTLDSWTLMARLNRVNSQYGVFVSTNAYLGDAAASLNSTWRTGASTLLLASLTFNLTQHLQNAMSQVKYDVAGNAPNVKEAQERGSIAYSVHLLNRANAYMQYQPLQAPAGTVQNTFENFTLTYAEAPAKNRGVRIWVSTGYNKEIAETLLAGTTVAIYGEQAAARYFPSTTSAFFLFWNSMVGKTGAYEIDNTPHYGTFNAGMMFHLAVVLNRLNRGTENDTDAYMSDSPDINRIVDRMALQYVYVSSGQAVWPLRMAYMMTGNVTYLWASRKIDRFYYNVMPNHTAVFDDLTHANIQRYDLLNLKGPASTTQPYQTFLRVSTMYYKGLLINRGATNANTVLVPDKIILRTSSHDLSSWAVLGLSGAGHHANTDQRLCLDNSMFMGAYMVHRRNRPSYANQCNGPFAQKNDINYPYPLAFPDLNSDYSTATQKYMDVMQYQFDPSTGTIQNETQTYPTNITYSNVLTLGSHASGADVLYGRFQHEGLSVRRQVIMTDNGVMVVKDTYTASSNLAYPVKAGVNWRLWDNVTLSGPTWALQAPRTITYNDRKRPLNETTQTLFSIQSDSSTANYGFRTEFDDFGSPVTNFFSWALLKGGDTVTFMTLISTVRDQMVNRTALEALVAATVADYDGKKFTVPADSASSYSFSFEPMGFTTVSQDIKTGSSTNSGAVVPTLSANEGCITIVPLFWIAICAIFTL